MKCVIGKSKNTGSIPLKKRKRTRKRTTIAATISSPCSTDKYVVSDDDGSVFIRMEHPKNNSKRKKQRASKKKDVAPLQSLEPLPLKLNKSQIHSKKYNFPQKLFDLLEKVSLDDRSSEIVSWSPDGTTFVVHDHGRFAAEILPTYFGHTQFRSFDRQLNYWGFALVSPRKINNMSFGGKTWKHPFFQKDRRDLLKQVTRKVTGASSSLRKITSLEDAHKKNSCCMTHATMETTSRVINSGQTTNESEIGKYTGSDTVSMTMDTRLRTRLRVRKNLKGVSKALGLPPRMVSPVHGSQDAERINHPVQEIIFSALGIVNGTCNGQMPDVSVNDQTTVSTTNIEDEFFPLFPLESLDDDRDINQKQGAMESFVAKDIAPFVDAKITMRDFTGSNPELCKHDDAFKGHNFHDVDLTMDMDINMDMDMDMDMDTIIDEIKLFQDIIDEDKR